MQLLYKGTYWLFVSALVVLGTLVLLSITTLPWAPKVKVVKSGSMEPSIHVGAIVAIAHQASYNVGDVITFGKDTKTQFPTTHRIVEIKGEGASQTFKTKGDANDAPDPTETRVGDIQGKVVVSVPYVGYLLAFARTKIGFAVLVGIPALMIVLEEGWAILQELAKMKRKRRGANTVNQQTVAEKAVEPLPKQLANVRVDGIRAAGKLNNPSIAALVIVLAAGALFGMGKVSGNTLAHFTNQQTSGANLFKAGTFNQPQVVADTEVTTTAKSIEAPADTPELPLQLEVTVGEGTLTVQEPVPEVVPELPKVEISEPVITIDGEPIK